MKKCPICGKEYINHTVVVLNTSRTYKVPDCDCEAKQLEAEELTRNKSLQKQKMNELFENSLMTPFFQEKDFKNLPASNIKTAVLNYIEDFNPIQSGGIMLIGNVGTGKTTLLACTCKELLLKGYSCLFIKMSTLLDKFISACSFESDISVEKLKYWLLKFDFIVIDDLGREKYTEKRLEIAFDIIDDLMNYKKCFGITANNEMIAKLKKIPDFEAILDRLFEMCKIQETFKGESFRRKQVYNGKYD